MRFYRTSSKAGIRYFHFGVSNIEERLQLYNSAIFIPRQNSHKYWKKKLFHILSSPSPDSPTKVDHIKLIANAIPPFNIY